MARHFVEHDKEHRNLLFRAHVYFRIYLLADVLHFVLTVLRDENDDGKDEGFEREQHREEVERVRVEDSDALNVAEVDEYPEDEDANVCNEKRYRSELQGEKFRERARPRLIHLKTRFYLFPYALLARSHRLLNARTRILHAPIIAYAAAAWSRTAGLWALVLAHLEVSFDDCRRRNSFVFQKFGGFAASRHLPHCKRLHG